MSKLTDHETRFSSEGHLSQEALSDGNNEHITVVYYPTRIISLD